MVEVDRNYASKGQANLNTVLGSLGTASFAMPILGGLLGGWGGNNCGAMFAWERELSCKDAESGSLLEDLATDRKILELYQYVDGRMRNIEGQLCQQAVVNAQVTANISCMQNTINTLSGLTKTVIPINSICPEPMQRYNTWVAPTAEATTAP